MKINYWPFLYEGMVLRYIFERTPSFYIVVRDKIKGYGVMEFNGENKYIYYGLSGYLDRDRFFTYWDLNVNVYNYVPKTNQGREFCFYCNKKTKEKYDKILKEDIIYCPECLR